MDWLAILMALCTIGGGTAGVMIGIVAAEKSGDRIIQFYVDECHNLWNQLALADKAAEEWRDEAYRLGYKPNQS